MNLDPKTAAFAAAWLNEGINGMKIDGFGPNDPPPPEIDPERLRATNTMDNEDEEPAYNWPLPPAVAPQMTTNPLVALGTKLNQPQPEPRPAAELWVSDAEAVYKEQSVTLTPQEKAAVAQIVLRAIVNRAKAQYDALLKQAPKRVRVRRERTEDAETSVRNQGGVRSGQGVGGGADGKRQRRRRQPAAADHEGGRQGDPEAGAGAQA